MPPPAVLPTPRRRCLLRAPRPRLRTSRRCRSESSPRNARPFDLVRLDRDPDARPTQVAVNPPAPCSCAAWPRRWRNGSATTSAPRPPSSARRSPPSPTTIHTSAGRRNRINGAKLSEHGKGNALDVGAIKLANGAMFNLTDPLVAKAVPRADARLRLRPLHHGARARLGRLSQRAHPSRSRRALATAIGSASGMCSIRQCSPARCRCRGPGRWISLPTDQGAPNENGAELASGAARSCDRRSISSLTRPRRPAPCAD